MAILTFDSGESSARTRTLTYTLPNFNSLNSVKVDTGNVSVISINGDSITVQVSKGTYVRRAVTGWQPQPDLSKYVDNQTSSNYSDSSGYSGTLSAYEIKTEIPESRKPASQIESGEERVVHMWNGSQWVFFATLGVAPSTVYYNRDGYTGTLSQDYVVRYDSTLNSYPSNPSMGDTFVRGTIPWNAGYKGEVYRPASTTTVTRYRGYVYKPQPDLPVYTYYYRYIITFDYVDFTAPPVNVNGVYREVKEVYVNVNGTWRKVTNIYGKINRAWKQHVK